MDRYYTLFKTIPFQDQDDPTANTNYTETYTRDSRGNTQASGEDTSIALQSVTPEGRIDIETNDYVNNIAKTITKPKSAMIRQDMKNTALSVKVISVSKR